MDFLLKLFETWNEFFDNKSDPRVKSWFMMSSPFPTLAICLLYVYSVKVLGPKLMENRRPFKLRNVLIIYNFLQVLFSAWVFYQFGVFGWFGGYNYRCQPVDYSMSPLAVWTAHVVWWYYFSKFTEFFDTFFFIMLKRYDQVSTLHVIHHGVMPFSVWWGVKFMPGGHLTFFGFLNSGVHVIMYTYYMFAAMGPAVQKYLWWKKYLTTLQMVQFVVVGIHAFQLLFSNPCNFPLTFVWIVVVHSILFLVLFKSFYKQAYIKSKADGLNKKFDGATKASNSVAYLFKNRNKLVCQSISAYDENH